MLRDIKEVNSSESVDRLSQSKFEPGSRLEMDYKFPLVRRIYDNLERLYMKQERWKDAERLQSRVLEELPKTDVIDMRKFNFYRKRRGMSSLKLGRLDIAVEDFRALLDEADAPPEDFEELLVLLFHVAMAYSGRQELKESEKLFHEAIRFGQEKDVEHTSHAVRCCMSSLALQYDQIGRYEEAEELYNRMLDSSGNIAEELILIRSNLGVHYIHQGRFSEAIEMLHATLKMATKQWGGGHPKTMWIRDNLWSAYCWADKIDAEASIIFHEGLLYGQFEELLSDTTFDWELLLGNEV